MDAIRINPKDDVAVALEPIAAGTRLGLPDIDVTACEDIPLGHKIALRGMPAGHVVTKYGQPIGALTCDVAAGCHVHTHNLKTLLQDTGSYTYDPVPCELARMQPDTFKGYRRADGRVGIRNELWIIPTVVCVGGIGRAMAHAAQHLVAGSVEGVHCFEHPFGCSQVGGDLQQTARTLAGLVRHPNAGGVLVLSLGCEELTEDLLREHLGDADLSRVRFLRCQDVEDEKAQGAQLLEELAALMAADEREDVPASELIIGLECGGSDGLSGITANPVIGRVSDCIASQGGTSVLTEVPEMFGGEAFLLNRCCDRATFDAAVAMVNGFKAYFTAHGAPVYDNPSPGNKAGGITTLEDKSCGCVQKGGTASVRGVVAEYGAPVSSVTDGGLVLYSTPGNDPSSVTGLAAAGCHLVLFSSGRGTPFEAPVPTVKVSSNSELARHKSGWIDFNAGVIADGERSIDEAGEDLYQLVLRVASGKQTKSEARGIQGISIWKDGVYL